MDVQENEKDGKREVWLGQTLIHTWIRFNHVWLGQTLVNTLNKIWLGQLFDLNNLN